MKPSRLAAVGLGLGAAAVALTARRARVSVPALLVGRVLVPWTARRRRDPGRQHALIAADRKRGPALPPRRLLARHEFRDEMTDAGRVLTLSPRGGPIAPTRILYLHGGAYVLDLMAPHWTVIAGLVDRTGASVSALVYPLAPESDCLAGLDAAERAFEALAAQAGAANVVVAGDSAGGGLALALAHRLRDRGRPLPAALVLLSPWLDVTLADPGQRELEKLDAMLVVDRLREAGRLWARGLPPADPRASPLFGDQRGLPPTLVLIGTADLLLSDARRFAATGAGATVREYPGMFHVWMAAPIPEGRRALDEAAAFIREHG